MTALNNTGHAADAEDLVANSARRYVKIVYGSVPERTSLDETIQKGGVAKQLEAAWSLIEIYAEKVDRAFESRVFKSRAFETSGGRDVAYEADDLIKDCRSTIEVLNDLIRALIRDKTALYDIIGDLELEKLKAADAPR